MSYNAGLGITLHPSLPAAPYCAGPAGCATLNATYTPTGALVDGYPAFFAGPEKNLFRHPELDQWILSNEPFDPAKAVCAASITVAGGPVPTGARAWEVADGMGEAITAVVTAREVA
jgi:hypothetical protein